MVLSGDRIVFFRYGTKETEYLKARDARLGSLIERIGHIDRETDPDLFSSVIRHIIGQQISSKAQKTIWNRMLDSFGSVTPDVIAAAGIPRLQSFGMTFRKADYIAGFASDVLRGKVDLGAIERMTDEDAIRTLTGIRGIGTWTAEMILLFSLGRPDILSFGDLAIQRGLRMVYHHKAITPALFRKYQRRFSPYGSVASLYLWAAAAGADPELRDYAPMPVKKGRSRKRRKALPTPQSVSGPSADPRP